MAWTEITRFDHDRSSLRYASDCTDNEWRVISPFLSRPRRVGHPGKHELRIIWDATRYIASTGCQWRMLPTDFPPFTTVQYHFYRWRDSGLLETINEALVSAARLISGRNRMPSAAIVDSQPVKTTAAGGPTGYDAGKKIKGHKRYIVTDIDGNLLKGIVHTADIQDRDGAPEIIKSARRHFPGLIKLFADGGYAGEKFSHRSPQRFGH